MLYKSYTRESNSWKRWMQMRTNDKVPPSRKNKLRKNIFKLSKNQNFVKLTRGEY